MNPLQQQEQRGASSGIEYNFYVLRRLQALLCNPQTPAHTHTEAHTKPRIRKPRIRSRAHEDACTRTRITSKETRYVVVVETYFLLPGPSALGLRCYAGSISKCDIELVNRVDWVSAALSL